MTGEVGAGTQAAGYSAAPGGHLVCLIQQKWPHGIRVGSTGGVALHFSTPQVYNGPFGLQQGSSLSETYGYTDHG